MKYARPFAAVAALAIGGSVVAATGATATSGRRPQGWQFAGAGAVSMPRKTNAHDIAIRAVLVHDQIVDVAPAGMSPGDYDVFEERLYSPKTGQVIGKDSLRCMPAFTTSRCDGTFILSGRGQIELSGAFTRSSSTLSITGGTGNYRNVRGQAVVGASHGDTTHLTLQLLP